MDFSNAGKCRIYLAGVAVAAESVPTVALSVATLAVFIVSVVAGVLCIVLSTAAVESEVAVDIEDSLVPQLMVTNPNTTAANITFFIIFIF